MARARVRRAGGLAVTVVLATAGLAAGAPAPRHGTPPGSGHPSLGTPLPPGVSERHVTLTPTGVERLPGNLVRTTFDGGISHVGGAVRAMRVTERLTDGARTGVALEAVLADQGYPTPEAYRAAGRSVAADLAAVAGERPASASASPGQVVQSGCARIDVESYYYAYGCYARKLAQNLPTGEILGETGHVTCRSRYYDMAQCGAELRHAWVDRYAYIFDWAPSSDQESTSCTTKTWSLGWGGVSYSQSTQQCPTEYRIGITGEPGGAMFRNSWHGRARSGVTRSAAVVDTYRWQTPAQYRGSFRYVILVDTSPGSTKYCSATCTAP